MSYKKREQWIQAEMAHDKLQRAQRELGDAHSLMRAMQVEDMDLYQGAYLNLAALAGLMDLLL